ncbi:MAG: glutathione S-transferase family protein, partial [Desulfocapsaceae bacterium]
GDFFTLHRLFDDMQSALKKSTWLTGNNYSMADTAIIAYVDRLDRLGMSGLWEKRFPSISNWLEASKARPSYEAALHPFVSQNETENTRRAGEKLWPEVKKRWDDFLTAAG